MKKIVRSKTHVPAEASYQIKWLALVCQHLNIDWSTLIIICHYIITLIQTYCVFYNGHFVCSLVVIQCSLICHSYYVILFEINRCIHQFDEFVDCTWCIWKKSPYYNYYYNSVCQIKIGWVQIFHLPGQRHRMPIKRHRKRDNVS